MKRVELILLTYALVAATAVAEPADEAPPPSVEDVVEAAAESLAASKLPADLREKKYFYSSFGMRDPFRSLLDGEFEPKLQELVDLNTVNLVGVLWEDDEYVAMLQDRQGFGYNLRPGDKVRSGRVVSISENTLVARLDIFGQTTRRTLRLQREEREE